MQVFETVGKVKSLKIIKKDGMSCGYGFVEFSSERSARKAMRNLNNKVIDDHAIKLQESK